MPKVEIHLEFSVPSNKLSVSQLEAIQDLVLDQVLGPKWADVPQDEAPWVCPRCQS